MKSCRCRLLLLTLLSLVTLAALAVGVLAAPMWGTPWSLKQPDGKFVDVRIFGDEYYHDVESPDGYTLIRDPVDGFICYATLSLDGNEYVSTKIRVGNGVPRGIAKHLRINSNVRALKAQQMRDRAYAPEAQLLAQRGMTALAGPPDNGNVLGLCLLADFSDQPATIAQGDVVDFCNLIGYSQNGNNGSVRDYFFDVSDGNLTYTHYVSPAYYRPANTFAWYDDCNEPWLDRGIQLIVEILNDMDSDGFDFSGYDSNSDGLIDAINLFYAGNTTCGWAKGMWPGSGSMGGFAADGVSANRFQITGMGAQLTIGTYCHENGHMICYYPDLYDYDGDSAGPGDFCLMASGGPARNPTEVCAPLKVNSGWATVNELSGGGKQTGLSLPAGTNTYYQYTRGFNVFFPGENFLIENRQQTARDAGLPDAGLVIWHVEEVWGNHNDQSRTMFGHYPYTVMQADGDWDLENNVNNGDNTDAYAAPSFTALTPCTDPNTNWWDGGNSGFAVTNVSAIGANMTFDFSPDDEDPVAQVKSFAEDADQDCCISVSVDDINDGTYDPDGPGDIESLCITAVDGNSVGCQQTVTVCGDGLHTVTLTVTDLCGNTDSEDASVEVVNDPPVAVAKNFAANADDNCCITVNLSDIDGGTYDPDGAGDIETFCITAVDGGAVGCVQQVTVCGNGLHTVTLTATDYCGFSSSADATVDVIDVTPPEITVVLDRTALWPPNHKMVTVCATVEVTDNCDPNPTFVLESATSDEPDDGTGDGHFPNDIQNAATETPDLCVDLRSERKGNGDGRVYTIVYRATDASGNEAWATVTVDVPHDQGANAMASSGFVADGTGFSPFADRFAVIIPSVDGLDATAIDRSQIYFGNTAGVEQPVEIRVVELQNDGRPDLALFFTVEGALAIMKPDDGFDDGTEDQKMGKGISDGTLGVHFVSATGVDYLVADVLALGNAVEMPGIWVDTPPPILETPKPDVPKNTALTSIHPNPFNPQTTVAFSLASEGLVRIAIYDVRGTLIRRLTDGVMPAGEHTAVWNGIDDAGRPAASGIYFVRMIAGNYSETKKIVMLK